MTTIALDGFSGIIPRSGISRLGMMNAQLARNVKLQSGELRPWRKPVFTYQPINSAVKTIYQHYNPAANQTRWLTFDSDVDIVAGVLADSSDWRLYYTSDGFSPRKTHWGLSTWADSNPGYPYPGLYYNMGVPGPTAAPTLSASGGTAPTETRAYVYTFINEFGTIVEESAPSPAATVTCNSSGATVTLSALQVPPVGAYNYTKIRIYRTVTGTATVSYQFVKEIALPTTSTTDALTVTQLGEVLTSTFYTPPPSDMRGLVEMPNGMLAGFTGNQIWFCEPYKPHAWPVSYMQTTEYPIVGLGVFGTSLFVGTEANPYLLTGSSPAAMSSEKLSVLQPCTSKRSIVSDQWGIVYSSPNGLMAIGPGVQDLITQALYTRDEWQVLNPVSIAGLLYNNMYMGFFNNGTGPTSAFVFSRADTPPLATYDFPATGVYIDRRNSNIYAVSADDNAIYQLDADPHNATIFQWRSRLFQMNEPTNFGALKVKADYSYIQGGLAYNNQIQVDLAYNLSLFNARVAGGQSLGGCPNDIIVDNLMINGSDLRPIVEPEDVRSIQVAAFADDQLVFEIGVTSDDPVRLPAGFKATHWELLITGNTPVRRVTMSTTIDELRKQ
jgi:hypothetical protein